MNNTTKSFVSGAAILGFLGLICKVIGALYRIPMTNLIGTQGMAFYQTAYPVYAFLLAVSSAGLPVAVSKMVSERLTLGDYASARSVFRTALNILMIIGLITTIAMVLLARPMADAVSRPDAYLCFIAIAPALFFVSIMSAYRGYFQGMQQMAPTAFSQLLEQIGKLGFGLLLAYWWLDRGIEWAAAGAILGVTISEVLSLLFVMILYRSKKNQFDADVKKSVQSRLPADRKTISKNLLYIAVPIVVGACAMPLVQVADTAVVTNTLISMGYTQASADSLFGNLTSVVNPLINMPAVLSLALAMSLVPAISASRAKNDELELSSKSSFGFKLAMLVGLPCAVGFYLLAEPIIKLLYSSLPQHELTVAASLLSIMAVAVLFLTIVQTMTGILQGLGKPTIPVINLLIGVAVKIILSISLIRIPEIGILGAAIGTVACYGVAGILDIIFAIKYSKMKLKPINNLLKPIVATVGMGAVIFILRPILFQRFSNTVSTVLCIGAGMVIYLLLAVWALEKQDTVFLPGGRKLSRLMNKLGLWRS